MAFFDAIPAGWLTGPTVVLGPQTCTDGRRVVTHLASARKRRQALHFYRVLAPQLRALGAGVPELLDAHGALLLRTWHPGNSDPGPTAHRAAGRWLRHLHDLQGLPVDPLPLEQAVARRIAALCPALPPPWGRALGELDLRPLAEQQRVWCHRDLRPRNWLWDGVRLVVLDFEHAAPDLGALDFARVPDPFALLEGYGRSKVTDKAVLSIAGILDAAGTLAWGLRHEDPERVFTGQQRLRAWIPIG